MNRDDLILAALAAAGRGVSFPPAQVQKLFFLIDREIPDAVGGPHFDFTPYDYGPFDSTLYTMLDLLQSDGLVEIGRGGRYRTYSLTERGWQQGQPALLNMVPAGRSFIEAAAKWVNSLSFSQLVSAIYQKYPDMKERSVFRA